MLRKHRIPRDAALRDASRKRRRPAPRPFGTGKGKRQRLLLHEQRIAASGSKEDRLVGLIEREDIYKHDRTRIDREVTFDRKRGIQRAQQRHSSLLFYLVVGQQPFRRAHDEGPTDIPPRHHCATPNAGEAGASLNALAVKLLSRITCRNRQRKDQSDKKRDFSTTIRVSSSAIHVASQFILCSLWHCSASRRHCC